MDCKEIIKKYLKEHGFDGLANEYDCGCGLGDFAPCGEGPYPYCKPAHRSDDEDGWYYNDELEG